MLAHQTDRQTDILLTLDQNHPTFPQRLVLWHTCVAGMRAIWSQQNSTIFPQNDVCIMDDCLFSDC